ncbi:hypothetical protein SAMN03159448_06194 [Sinorhizobium sp. NFACC03]|nr:hypothetical protein SAMN03159448_06194 [Sinorhizobium sp. NFACC03]
MRLPLTLRNFIANLKFERDDALDIRGNFAVELNIVPAVVAAKGSAIGAQVRACQSDIRHGVGNEKIRFELNSPAMNLLHRLEIAELDDLFIDCKLRQPFQRLPAAWIGEYRRRKELFCLNGRASVRRWGGCFHGRLRLWHWLRRRRCSLWLKHWLHHIQAKPRQFQYPNGYRLIRGGNGSPRRREKEERQHGEGMNEESKHKASPDRCLIAATRYCLHRSDHPMRDTGHNHSWRL